MSRQLEISWNRGLLRCLDIQSNKALMRRSFLNLKVLWKKFTALKLGKHSANYNSIPTPSFKYKYITKWKHRQQCIKLGALLPVRQCAIAPVPAPVRPCVPSNVKDLHKKKINKENKAEERGKRVLSNYNWESKEQSQIYLRMNCCQIFFFITKSNVLFSRILPHVQV